MVTLLALLLALAEPPSVAWVRGGRLLVGGQWLYGVAKEKWTRLPGHVDRGGVGERDVVRFEGRRVLWTRDGRTRDWTLPPLASEPEHPPWGVLLDDRRLLVFEDEACAIVRHDKEFALERPKTCPEGEMVQLWDFRPGPGDLAVVYTEGEGHPAVNVVRWTPERGQRPADVPTFDLYPQGPLEVSLDREGAWFVTPCDLTRKGRPCMNPDGSGVEGPASLYRWVRGKGLARVAPAPAGATWSAGLFAWGEPGRVCTAPPRGQPRCVDVPR